MSASRCDPGRAHSRPPRSRQRDLEAAIGEALERCAAQVLPAYRSQGRWREAIRAGLEAMLLFVDEQPAFGRLLIVESLCAGDAVRARRAQVLSLLVDAVDEGRGAARVAASVSRSTAEGVVGAVLAILHARMIAEPRRPLLGLTGELMAIVVLPYLGPAAAARQARRPPIAPAAQRRPADPLAGLQIRLTHRTLLVLRALAELDGRGPGASNSQIARLAGISDAGQISKLLARLAGAGLIVNARDSARRKGQANSWRLTGRGAAVARATRRQV